MNYVIEMTVDLRRKHMPYVPAPHVLMIPGENAAHVWEITVLEGKQAADLTGYTASARFERADGFVREVYGSISGNVASVTLNKPVYSVPGLLRGQFYVKKGSQVVALVEALFEVRPAFGGDMALTLGDVLYYAYAERMSYGGKNYFELSATTAVETDVRTGKKFFRADGILATGDASFNATITGGSVTATLISGDDYELTISEVG